MLIGPDDGIEMEASDGTPEGFELDFDEGRHFLLLTEGPVFYGLLPYKGSPEIPMTTWGWCLFFSVGYVPVRYKGSTFFPNTYRYSQACVHRLPTVYSSRKAH